MKVEELEEKDNSFNSMVFISKVNNMIKKLYNATTLNELETVNHFVSDKVFNMFKEEVDTATNKNEILIYDQVNVNSEIQDISEDNNNYIIKTISNIKYLKYYTDMNGNFKHGDQEKRLEVIKTVILKKPINGKLDIVNRCLGCGTPLNINDNGKCPTCGRLFDLEEYDFYIEDFV